MAHEPANPVPALARGLLLLRRLEADGATSLERLSRTTGLPKSSVRRLLRSLELCHAVRRDPRTLRYTATLRLVEHRRTGASLLDVAEPVLTDLAERTGQTAELYEPDLKAATLTMIHRAEPEVSVVTARARVGSRRESDEVEATAQVLLRGVMRRHWPRRAWAWIEGQKTPINRAAVARHVNGAVDDGVAVDLGINPHGVRRYAAPVLAGPRLRGVIAIAQVCTPLNNEIRSELRTAVRDAGRSLTDQLQPREEAA